MVDVVAAGGSRHGRVAIRAGGTPVNAAVAAAALGARASVVARVGDDPAAALVRSGLADAGVEARLAVDSELSTGCFVQVGDVVVADRGANAGLAATDVRVDGADALLVSGYTLLHDDTLAAGRAALDAEVAWRGVDAASAALVVTLGAAEAAARFEQARVLFLDAGEAYALIGLEPEAAATELAARHEVVVVKLGVGGALATRGDEKARVAAPALEVASPLVGAGDALDAGVLVGLARGLGLAEALALGCEAVVMSTRGD
jgi:ribokinase